MFRATFPSEAAFRAAGRAFVLAAFPTPAALLAAVSDDEQFFKGLEDYMWRYHPRWMEQDLKERCEAAEAAGKLLLEATVRQIASKRGPRDRRGNRKVQKKPSPALLGKKWTNSGSNDLRAILSSLSFVASACRVSDCLTVVVARMSDTYTEQTDGFSRHPGRNAATDARRSAADEASRPALSCRCQND